MIPSKEELISFRQTIELFTNRKQDFGLLLMGKKLESLRCFIADSLDSLGCDHSLRARDALEIYDLLDIHRQNYEIIWVKIAGSEEIPPEHWISIGFEPSYFYSDHFSASCDCMLFPRWHGTDEEGCLFDTILQN